MTESPEVSAGWLVTAVSGEIVSTSDGPTAATMTGTSDTERGEHDGSDSAGASESHS